MVSNRQQKLLSRCEYMCTIGIVVLSVIMHNHSACDYNLFPYHILLGKMANIGVSRL